MGKFKFKPPKGPIKNKYLIMREWFKVLDTVIPHLQSYEQAAGLESDLYNARHGGMISDTEYVKYSNMVKEVCKQNNWAMP